MSEWNSYTRELNRRGAPPDEDLRAEAPGLPTVGDMIRPGTIVATSYDTGPYLVKSVTPYPYYERFRAWSLVVIYQDRDTGEFIDRVGGGYGYLNELVVDHEGPEPVIRHLFRANPDTVTIIKDHGFTADRRGQLALF